MTLEPPPITIVNPNAPMSHDDVPGYDHAPWRPSRRLILMLAAAICLLAGLASGAKVLWEQHEQRQLVATELRSVQLTGSVECCDDFIGSGTYDMLLLLTNGGPDPLTLRSVRFGTAPAWTPDATYSVSPGDRVALPIPEDAPCHPRSGREEPNMIAVSFTLPHGQRVNRDIAIARETLELIKGHIRSRCRTLTPSEALFVEIVRSRATGRALTLDLAVWNQSATPVTIRSVHASPGLTVAGPRLPRVVPPATSPQDVGPRVRITLVIQPQDCRAFGQDEEPSGDQAHVLLTVDGPIEREAVRVYLNTTNDGILPTEVYAHGLLRRWCGLQES